MAYQGIPPRMPPAAPPSSVPIFSGGQLNIDRKRGVTAVLPGAAGGGIIQEKYMRSLNGERARLMTNNMPVKAPNPGETAYPGLFNDMAYHTDTPAPNEPQRATPGTIAQTEEHANTRIPVWRIMSADSGASMIDLPSKHGLVILKKSRLSDAVSFQIARNTNQVALLNSLSAANTGQYNLMNVHPLVGFNPVAWLAALHEQLLKILKKFPDRYRSLTCRDIWRGVADQPWTGWTTDGVVRGEQDETRASTAASDGFHQSTIAGGHWSRTTHVAKKLMTIITSGEQEMLDYFGSRGLQEGASLWMVFIKYEVPANQADVTYVKTNKAVPLEIGGETVAVRMAVPDVMTPDGAVVRFRPPGLFFVANPTGGELDPSFAEYTNEYGDKQYGVIMFLGRVMFLPPRFKQQSPPITSPDSPYFRPFTNGGDVLTREHPTVLLPTHKDGLLNPF